MIKSFLIKAGMLAATAACVMWIGWPAHEQPGIDSSTVAPKEISATPPAVASALPARTPSALPLTAAPKLSTSTKTQQAGAASSVDINRATAEELQTLPGIGEVLAQRVIDRRKTHGLYRTVDALREVKGIGAKRFEKLRPLVTVGTTKDASRSSVRQAETSAHRSKSDL